MNKLYQHSSVIHNTKAASIILPFIFQYIRPESVIDVGCGLGTWLKIAKENGINNIVGIEAESIDESLLTIEKNNIIIADLNQPVNLDRKFDLVISLEVAEHLSPDKADVFVETLCGLGDCILFSAAIPGQGGQNHHNEQWPQYWMKKFQTSSFYLYDIIRKEFWNNGDIEWWYKQNMFLFSKERITGLEPCSNIQNYIHPDNFKRKIEILNSLKLQNLELSKTIGIKTAERKNIYVLVRLLFKAIGSKIKGR